MRGFGGSFWGERLGEGWEEVVERGEGGGEKSRGGLLRCRGFGREVGGGGGGGVDFGGGREREGCGLLIVGGAGSEGACGEDSWVEWMSGREGSRASSSAGMSNGSASAA